MLDEDNNYVTRDVTISLGDIIDLLDDTGYDLFLDLLADRFGTPLLTDIDYHLVRLDDNHALVFEVTGDVSYDDECHCEGD